MRTTYKALAYVAGVELLELGNYDEETDAMECLKDYFTDYQTGEIDEHGLSCSKVEPVLWNEYLCHFVGRKVNSLGVTYFVEETIYNTKKMNESDIRLSLYHRYQDISQLTIKEV
ncbi:MAG: hypothetical protein ABFD07_01895 [Methanobacterium sp.]